MAMVVNKKALFEMLMDHVPRFEAYWSQFFDELDWFVLLTSRIDANISRYGDFCANDCYNDNTTDYLNYTPCAVARDKK